jgi:flagellar assembly protein FliH
MNTSSNPVRRNTEEVLDFPYQDLQGTKSQLPTPAWDSQNQQRQQEAAAREAGIREGETRARAAWNVEIQQIKEDVAGTIQAFARERSQYFLQVEHEVVRLALNIARKILHRELQLDPLLLAGMVRVALEQTGQATRVTVRVHPHQVSDFRLYFAREFPENPPEVVEDAALALDRCALHTELGSTEIGPEIQLKEIEQGLLDLQAIRPAPHL